LSKRLRLFASLAGVCFALALPIAAHASTKTVYMGEPPQTANTFEGKYSADVSDYFPHTVTIHAGDSVKWIPSFHTVDFPASGQKPYNPFIATGPAAAGVNDQAGQPFWFNGQNEYSINPLILKVATKGTMPNSKRVESGLSAGPGKPKPYVVKFKKPGSYTYYCDLHPGMKGVVKVKKAGAKIPSAKQDAKTIANQLATALASAKQFPHRTAPTGTVLVGALGKGNVQYYGFVGPTAPISVGTTLTFQMSNGPLDPHTATTDTAVSGAPNAGPPNFVLPSPYLQGLVKTFEGLGPFDPTSIFPSDPAGGTPASLSPQLHGNGFWNTGVLDTEKSSSLPSSGAVRFDAPGTYKFYCLIHPFMELTVTVQ
jgi:plastocyanin